MTEPKQEYLSVAETAVVLGMSETKVRRLMSSGDLPFYRVGTTVRPRVRIARVELDEFLQANRVAKAPEPEPEPVVSARRRHRERRR